MAVGNDAFTEGEMNELIVERSANTSVPGEICYEDPRNKVRGV